MAEFEYSDTRTADAQALWTYQYTDKTVIDALTALFSDESQRIETAARDVRDGYLLDSAVGVQLDALGAIVGQAREGRTDAVYRLWIKARIRVNRSSGSPPDLYAVAQLVLGSGTTLWLRQFPVGHVVQVDDYLDVDPFAVQAILQETSSAGVPLHYWYAPKVAPFKFSDTGSLITSSPNGFGAGRLYGSLDYLSSPVEMPLSPLVEDLDVDGLSAGDLTSWSGSSGATYVTASDPATVTADARRDSLPSVVTAGGNSPPVDTAAPSSLVGVFEDSAFTVVWFGSQDSAGARNFVLTGYDDAFSDYMILGVDSSNRLTMELGDPVASFWDSGSATVTDTDDHTWAISYDGAGTASFFVDGVLVATDTQTHRTVQLTQIAVLGQDGGFREWGNLARLSVLGREITEAEALDTHVYLQRRYTDTYT